MTDYQYPYKDTEFVLKELVDFDGLCQAAGQEEMDTDFAMTILDEAAKLATEVLSPLNQVGDQQGATLTSKGVEETPGFADAYRQYVEAGWSSLTAAEEFEGQALPAALGTAINEMWQAANMAFALCPLLTQGAIEAIEQHGSEILKQTYLPKMIAGEWTGTMNLTESDAGSDLAAVKTKAIPNGDHYLISGQKIFITWGDHQMTDNIIHLVLARLPDAPPGVKGISLFLVPKFLVDEQGNIGERNDVHCVSLEHKLGIHASPTCVMSFGDHGGAVGYLVGEPHQGLMCMFTMMNNARQAVGVQGLSISDRSYQQALAYAKERLQSTNKDGSRDPIIAFPDVRRMLLQMKASIEAMRGLALLAAADIDRAKAAEDKAGKIRHQQRVELMTPIIKGWLTEVAQEVTSLGIQIHGGMGFIEETGSAQHYRDARILTIYEGTTGIQALDLVGRKTLLNQGEYLSDLLSDIESTLDQVTADSALSPLVKPLQEALIAGQQARQWLLENAGTDRNTAGAVSVPFMMLFGYLCGGWVMASSAVKAQARLSANTGDKAFLTTKLTTAQFYCESLLPRVHSYLAAIKAGSSTIMALDADHF